MADNETNELIKLIFESKGASATSRDIAQIALQLEKAKASNSRLKNEYGALEKKIEELVDANIKLSKAQKRASDAQQTAIKGLAASYGKASRAFEDFSKKVIGFASFGGLIAATKSAMNTLEKYNTALLNGSSIAKTYGVGISQLENRLSSLSSQINLTRQESIKLFQQYEKSAMVLSQGGFERMIRNVSNLVGPGVDAIGEYVSGLNAIVAKYPDLQQAMERTNDADRRGLQLAADRLLAIGEISNAEYRRLQSYARGAQQVNDADRARQNQIISQQRTFQDFARHAERISLLLGEAMMPALKTMGDFLEDNKDKIADLFDALGRGVEAAVNGFDSLINNAKVLRSVLTTVVTLWAGGKIFGMVKGPAMGAAKIAGGLFPSVAAGAGGVGSGIRGFFGASNKTGFARYATRMGRFGGAGLGLGLAGAAAQAGLGYYSNQAAESGNEGLAGGLQAGSGLAGAAMWAGTGATIGSILPGIGTGIGAIVGGIAGIALHSEDISSGISRLIGIESEQAKYNKEISEAAKKGREDARKYLYGGDNSRFSETFWQERQKEAIDAAQTAAMSDRNFANYADLRRSREEQQERVNALRSRQDALFANRVVGSVQTDSGSRDITASNEDIEYIRSKSTRAESALARVRSQLRDTGGMSEARVANLRNVRDELSSQLEQYEEIQKKIDQVRTSENAHTDEIRQAENALAASNAALETYQGRWKEVETLMKISNEYSQSQVAVLGSLIKYEQVRGMQAESNVQNQIAATQQALREEQQEIQKYIRLNQLREQGSELTDDQTKFLTTQRKYLGNINNARARFIEIESQILEISARIGERYQGQLSLLAEQSSLYSNIVSLADNFALGVGASAEMRTRSVQAMQKEIDLLEQQKREYEGQIARGGDSVKLRTQILQVENQILQKRQAQAQQLKALRDGWISALGAMNTGAGRFTKIMISQEQNLSASLRRFNQLQSSYSGAISQGWQSSSRFSSTSPGTLTGDQSGTAYDTFMGPQDSQAAYNLERTSRNQAAAMLDSQMRRQSERVIRGGGAAGVSATQQNYALSTMAGGPAGTSGTPTTAGLSTGRALGSTVPVATGGGSDPVAIGGGSAPIGAEAGGVAASASGGSRENSGIINFFSNLFQTNDRPANANGRPANANEQILEDTINQAAFVKKIREARAEGILLDKQIETTKQRLAEQTERFERAKSYASGFDEIDRMQNPEAFADAKSERRSALLVVDRLEKRLAKMQSSRVDSTYSLDEEEEKLREMQGKSLDVMRQGLGFIAKGIVDAGKEFVDMNIRAFKGEDSGPPDIDFPKSPMPPTAAESAGLNVSNYSEEQINNYNTTSDRLRMWQRRLNKAQSGGRGNPELIKRKIQEEKQRLSSLKGLGQSQPRKIPSESEKPLGVRGMGGLAVDPTTTATYDRESHKNIPELLRPSSQQNPQTPLAFNINVSGAVSLDDLKAAFNDGAERTYSFIRSQGGNGVGSGNIESNRMVPG